MRAALLFLIILIAIPTALVNSYYGLLVYYWINFMRPLELAWYIRYFDYGMFLATALLIGYFCSGIHKDPIRLTYLWPILLLWTLVALSAFFAYIPVLAQRKLWEFTKVIVTCVLTVSIIKGDPQRLKTLMRVIALSAGVLALHGLKQAIFTGGGMVKGPGGQLGENNDFAIFLNMMAPIIYYAGKFEESKRRRILYNVMAVSAAIAVIFTYSRAGFLALCAVVLIVSAKANRKWVGIGGLTFAVFVFLAFAPQAVKDRIASIKTARETDESTQNRFEAWECAGRMIRKHPFLGVGPMNFSYVFNLFKEGSPWDTHNGFLRIAAESGLPALAVFIFIIPYGVVSLRHARRKLEKAKGPPNLILYCHGLETMFAAYVVGNLFNSRHDLDNYYMLFSVIACVRIQANAWIAQNVMTEAQRRMQLFRERFALGSQGAHGARVRPLGVPGR